MEDCETLHDYCERLQVQNDLLKDVLTGASLTVTVEGSSQEILFSDLFTRLSYASSDDQVSTQREHHNCKEEKQPIECQSKLSEDELNRASLDTSEMSQSRSDEVPRFYKRDLMSILQEKNSIKEERDNLIDELEEWKRAAIESQELVNKLETELEIARGKLGGYAYATEIEANALGTIPRGLDFRPQVLAETVDVYITDIEVMGYAEQNGKFMFAIQCTWSDKRRFEVYRGYGEFFTFQHTLLLLFPEEAGKQKSERIIPSLPTADNVLAIFGATNKKSIVESRLQLISDYCTTILLTLPKKISRSILVKDFFGAKPGDKQLDSLERPRRHSLELSVYPLTPEGVSLGIYVAIADFEPSKDSINQLPLKAGDEVKIAQKDESGWWYVYQSEGDGCGFVPASFLKKPGESSLTSLGGTNDILGFIGSLRPMSNNGSDSHTNETDSHTTIETEASITIDPIFEYIAIEDYHSDDKRQLNFPEGAVLVVVEKSEDGWWLATYKGESGWVPSTYLVSRSQHHCNYEESILTSIVTGQIYVTVQSYTAKDEDELSVPAGVKVEVKEKSMLGWWKVKYKKKIGFVPAVILKPQQSDMVTDQDVTTSVTSIFSHSVSGIKRPPPRRKLLLDTVEKKRAITFITPAPIEEEAALDEESELDKRRPSGIKDWFQNLRGRKKTLERPESKKSDEQDSTRRNTGERAHLIAEPRSRSDRLPEHFFSDEDSSN